MVWSATFLPRTNCAVHRGATLIELIIVTAILVGLSGIVLVAMNAPERLRSTRETQERSNAVQLERALQLRMVDKFGLLGSVQTMDVGQEKDICKQGIDPIENDCVSLDDLVSERYIASIPVRSGYESDEVKVTGFMVYRDNAYLQVRSKVDSPDGGTDTSSHALFSDVPGNALYPALGHGFPSISYAAAVAEVDGTTYVGGRFSFVGSPVQRAFSVNRHTQQRTADVPQFTSNGIAVIEPRPDGGWYASGNALSDGVAGITSIVLILPNGTISEDWASPFPASFMPDDLAYDAGNDVLYVGGRYLNAPYLAAADGASGQLLWSSPTISPNTSFVSTLHVHESMLFVGGNFASIDGEVRQGGAIFDISAFPPELLLWNLDANGQATAFAVDGNTLYVGGEFDTVQGQSRSRIASFDISDMENISLRPWSPPSVVGGGVYAILPHADSVYIGGPGFFFPSTSEIRQGIIALSKEDATLDSWDPLMRNTGSNPPPAEVRHLATDGQTLYAGGYFRRVNGIQKSHVAAFDLNQGRSLTNFNIGVNERVLAMAMNANILAFGGTFNLMGQHRSHLAAFDAAGNLTNWSPDVTLSAGLLSGISTIVPHGSSVYIGGQFTQVNGQQRLNLAAFDRATGQLTSWNPGANASTAISAYGDHVYVTGEFTQVGGQTIQNLARIHVNGAVDTSWTPDPDAPIASIAFHGNGTYVGGGFSSIGAEQRSHIAALDQGGNALDWNPDADGPVDAMFLDGSTLYVGGDFSQIAEESRTRLASFDVDTGELTQWSPASSFRVRALEKRHGVVYVGGQGAQPGYLRAYATDGASLSWSPNLTHGSDAAITQLMSTDNHLHAVGYFSIPNHAGMQVLHYARFD